MIGKAVLITLPLVVAMTSLSESNAEEIKLQCRTQGGSGFELNIDLDNRLIEISETEVYKMLQFHDWAITVMMINPRLVNGEKIIVINRKPGITRWQIYL
ncbi:MAG TPA: hypothetical protein VGJ20_42745 [Xanthobacteraceae bacterium]|jgi:hypothetical protein